MRFRLLILAGILALVSAGCSRRPAPVPAPTATGAGAVATAASAQGTPGNRPPATLVAQPESAPAAVATATPEPGGRPLQVLGSQDPAGLSPDEPAARDPFAALVREALHASLLRPDPETFMLEPALAESWEVLDSHVVFHLRPDLSWTDGTPLTAADIADNLLAARDAGRGRTLRHITEASAPDARTLQVTLDTEPALCGAVSEIATWPVLDLVEPGPVWPPSRTSGAYSVEALDENTWRFTPRASSGGNASSWPPISTFGVWDYRQIDEAALLQAWREGTFDLIVGDAWLHGAGVPPGTPGSRSVSLQGPDLAVVAFRLSHSLLDDAGLRQALSEGTDPAALWEAVYGTPLPAALTALLPPGHWAAPPDGREPDVEAAIARLTALGWTDSDGDGVRERNGVPLRFELTLALSSDPRWEALALALREQWAALGVDLTPRYVEPPTLEEWLHKGNWEIALLAYHVPLDPDQGVLWQPVTGLLSEDVNVTGFDNAEAAELAARVASVPGCDPEERMALYHDFWDLVREEAPMIFLFSLPQTLFLGPDIVPPPAGAWPDYALSWQPRG